MLKVKDLQVYYGMINAIKGISFEVKKGEIVTLIGANGAGKTTILQSLSGMIKPKEGVVEYNGENILSLDPHKIVGKGLAHVPEGRRVFSEMTVEENLELGAFTKNNKDKIKEGFENAYSRFPRLFERKKQLAGTLSGGEQQMLAIARALMSNPQIILMDEPSMGLAPILVRQIFDIIQEINSTGMTVLLVEQNANMALSIANRAYVLETGKIVLSGDAKELLGNEEVKKAYLGA
ncbi:High-affinity branched-chain amino acid ABC transporter ATP-binding protein LivF [Gottschalkia acidurici 9a]|uniref:High-affinity branched-chain amino acid ABC transporter ATP-binding protein LivF n=1 Tax=Gottschalkia acidurici (strain ATCC 7906 / DSM 604 / BCRC 14475 / CIP 104303 / KCTC 5404 / NCIMB 10678 / 9a) TaxID=1128398 RepID=K0AY70_GOTA9|nr:ABC transporter ATP-binding protein [Gottschalkia acidurici]AFS78189.1 High-affinity branched-chain amino acid ABC transporter ATP-binding protein LivF [Gottschalkia acidurici 9a]